MTRNRKRQSLDWSKGPLPCKGCKRLLRPTSKTQGWHGVHTITAAPGQQCSPCYKKRKPPAKLPKVGPFRSEEISKLPAGVAKYILTRRRRDIPDTGIPIKEDYEAWMKWKHGKTA